jgi:CheY-like chemotaxis protein/HPt (histidine-containing phosphotransfer) domain-containing protein
VLDRLGVSTIVAQNGREALEQLGSQQAIDLVLMDCQMPLMDGYQATREWRLVEDRDARKRLPVVAMTANAMQGDREKCLDAGMDDYLPKPVSIADLQQMLDKWMPGRLDLAEDQGRAGFAPELESAETVVDEQVISELREVMGEEFQGLIATYLDNTPALIFQIREAMDAGDIESLILPAHSLKSSSANIGAVQMSELARKLEMAGRGEEWQAIKQEQPRLAPLFEETRDSLQPYLQDNQSSA